jgi:hypothetical protein
MKPDDRVITPYGNGTVVYKRMTLQETVMYSVRLDQKLPMCDSFTGTVFIFECFLKPITEG